MFLSRFNYTIAFDKIGVLFGNNNKVHLVHNLLTLDVKHFYYFPVNYNGTRVGYECIVYLNDR